MRARIHLLRQCAYSSLAVVLSVAIAPGDTASAASITSTVAASSDSISLDGSTIDSSADNNATAVAGQIVEARAFSCIGPCVVVPGPVPAWHDRRNGLSVISASAADAETDFGINRARAWSLRNDELDSDRASANSLWTDEVMFTSSFLGATTASIPLTFSIDGSWQNNATFVFNAGLYDPSQGFFDADAGGTFFAPVATLLAGNFQTPPEAPFHGDWHNIPAPGGGSPAGVTLIPNGDAQDGSFDLNFTLDADVALGHEYVLFAQLLVYANDANAELDAFSTATLSGIVLPSGVSMTSAANALGHYNVSTVPLPAGIWLLGSGLIVMARRLGPGRLSRA